MAEKCQVGSWCEPKVGLLEFELPPLDKVVPASRGTKLVDCLRLQFLKCSREVVPARTLKHLVVPLYPARKARADAEGGLFHQCLDQVISHRIQLDRRKIEHTELDAAGDVHAYCIRNHGMSRRKYPTDGKPISDVAVWHLGAPHRNGQPRGRLHLRERRVVHSVTAPNLVRNRSVT